MKATSRSRKVTADSDQGFTLVEVVVAMAIVGFLLMGLLSASLSAVRAATSARIDQQAGNLVTSTLEQLRSQPFSTLAMRPGDITTDGTITGTPAVWTVPNGVGTEAVVTSSTGAVTPSIQTLPPNANGVVYTLKRYVTQVPGEPTLRRLTVTAEWQFNGVTRSRTASTIVSNAASAEEGPSETPAFTVEWRGYDTLVESIPQGVDAEINFEVVNSGPDVTLSFTAQNNGVTASSWQFFRDPLCDSNYNPAAPLTGGQLIPSTGACFVMRWLTPPVGVYEVVVTGAVTGSTATRDSTPVFTLTVFRPEEPPCSPNIALPVPAGYALNCYVLRNRPTGNTTTPTTFNPMDRFLDVLTTQDAFYNYSTNITAAPTGPGRYLNTGGNTNNSASTSAAGQLVAEWRYRPISYSNASFPAIVQFWYLFPCTPGAQTTTLTVAVGVYDQTKNSESAAWSNSSRASATKAVPCGPNWRQDSVTVGSVGSTVKVYTNEGANRDRNDLTVRISNSGKALRLGYDAPDRTAALYLGIQRTTL